MVCDFKTPQQNNLIKHLATKHKKDADGEDLKENEACSQCDFKCVAAYQLKAHMLRKHTPRFPVSIQFCTYASLTILNNGLLFFRSDMQFQCGQCSYATVEKSALEKHVRFKHTKERPFECEVCGFSTHTKSHMTRLVRRYSILRLAWSNLGISL